MDDEDDRWRGAAALCLHLAASGEWPPPPSEWIEGDVDLVHLVRTADSCLPEGWDLEPEVPDEPEARWCADRLLRRLQSKT
jgi:hypothetical protein